MAIDRWTADRPAVPMALAALVVVLLGQASVLALMGQPWICACGFVRLWAGDVLGPENSQQIADWYTPSHVIHGVAFYYAIRLWRPNLAFPAAFALALALECGWEIIENSPPLVERYRSQALAQGYAGDSILNSVSDTVAAALGYLVARRIPGWAALALVVGLEVLAGIAIRDGLFLNILQIIHPVDAIQSWQTGRG